MIQENCVCGASLKLAHDCDGTYDLDVRELFNRLHSGPGHDERVPASVGNRIRHFYGARRDRKAASDRARAVAHANPNHEFEPTWCDACEPLPSAFFGFR